MDHEDASNSSVVEENHPDEGDPGLVLQAGRSGLEGLRVTRLLSFSKELGLSEDQVSRLRAIRAEFVRETIELHAAERTLRSDIEHVIKSAGADFDAVRSNVRQIHSLRLRKELSAVSAYQRGLEVLDAQQRNVLLQYSVEPMRYGVTSKIAQCEAEEEYQKE